MSMGHGIRASLETFGALTTVGCLSVSPSLHRVCNLVADHRSKTFYGWQKHKSRDEIERNRWTSTRLFDSTSNHQITESRQTTGRYARVCETQSPRGLVKTSIDPNSTIEIHSKIETCPKLSFANHVLWKYHRMCTNVREVWILRSPRKQRRLRFLTTAQNYLIQ